MRITHVYADYQNGAFPLAGGLENYLLTLLDNTNPGYQHQAAANIARARTQPSDLLHLHIGALLTEELADLPAIYTVHNNNPYCPSGGKFLAREGLPCDHAVSRLGCTWHHLVSGCGSRHPQRLWQAIQSAYSEITLLKRINIPVLANSDYVRGQLIRHGLPPEQVTTLRYGIPLPKIPGLPLTRSTHSQRRFLFAGRIVPNKGLDWLLQAMTHLDSSFHLDIAGDGYERPRLEKLTAQLGLSQRIVWHGWCQREQLRQLYQQTCALVFPSLWHEPAGIVTLEAYSQNRLVIASAVGGIPEHIQTGRTGYLVSPGDEIDLAEAMQAVAQNYARARAMGEAGYHWLESEFTLTLHLSRLQQIYQNVLTHVPAGGTYV